MLTLGLFAVFPRRNIWGNPGDEVEPGRCRLADGSLVRLYRGEPDATVANWYTATLTPPGLGVERQIVFSYSAPAFEHLACNALGLQLTGPDENGGLALRTSEASAMRWRPRTFWHGSEHGAEARSRVSSGQLEGAALLLLGIAVLATEKRRQASGARSTA